MIIAKGYSSWDAWWNYGETWVGFLSMLPALYSCIYYHRHVEVIHYVRNIIHPTNLSVYLRAGKGISYVDTSGSDFRCYWLMNEI